MFINNYIFRNLVDSLSSIALSLPHDDAGG